MILRGIAARRLLSLTIFVLAALVVSGTVVTVVFSRLTDVSRGSAGALVLLAFVALTAQAVESVRRREPELALARLRGRRGPRLLFLAVAEPWLLVLAGSAVGVAIGLLVARAVVDAWLVGSPTVHLGHDEWLSVALVTAGSLLLVLTSSWRILRSPLLDQIAAARRPRRATTVGIFLQLILVLGAAVSIYQAHRAAADRVDWVTLVSPAVVGLAAGQIVIWLAMAGLAVVVARAPSARIGWFLTVRRLLRRADGMAAVRMVIAAGVVFGVAASASNAAAAWREDRARLQVGAPVSYPVAAGALRAYATAHEVDPKGSWLLPAASYIESTEPKARRAFVDADRWQAVAGGFFDGTLGSSANQRLADLSATGSVTFGHGTTATATVETSSFATTRGVNLTVQYVDDTGSLTAVNVPMQPGRGSTDGPGLTRYTARVPGCRTACTVIEVDIGGITQDPRRPGPPMLLVDATFVGLHLLGTDSGMRLVPGQLGLHVVREGSALAVKLSDFNTSSTWALGRFRGARELPGVSTGDILYDTDHGSPTIGGIDGSPRAMTVAGTVPVLPFVGTSGTLLDLGSALAGSGGSIPETAAVILARADTPAAVISRLRATGAVGRPTSYDEVVTRLGQSPRAQGTRLYLLVAVFAALIALVSIASTVSQQKPDRRTEAASLRSVGLRPRAVAGAYRRESMLLGVATTLGTALGAWLTSRVLLQALPLVSGWNYAPPLDAAPRLPFIAVTALVAGVAVGLVTYVAFRGVGRASQPRLLREDLT